MKAKYNQSHVVREAPCMASRLLPSSVSFFSGTFKFYRFNFLPSSSHPGNEWQQTGRLLFHSFLQYPIVCVYTSLSL